MYRLFLKSFFSFYYYYNSTVNYTRNRVTIVVCRGQEFIPIIRIFDYLNDLSLINSANLRSTVHTSNIVIKYSTNLFTTNLSEMFRFWLMSYNADPKHSHPK
jgi:hypothetical protein